MDTVLNVGFLFQGTNLTEGRESSTNNIWFSAMGIASLNNRLPSFWSFFFSPSIRFLSVTNFFISGSFHCLLVREKWNRFLIGRKIETKIPGEKFPPVSSIFPVFLVPVLSSIRSPYYFPSRLLLRLWLRGFRSPSLIWILDRLFSGIYRTIGKFELNFLSGDTNRKIGFTPAELLCKKKK